MQHKYHLDNGMEVLVDANALGEGGEGGVYPVIAPANLKSSVAKIILNGSRTIEKRYKVDYMIKNPPTEIKDRNGHSFLVWPEHLLFNNGQFVGFLIPRAEGILLEELVSTELGFYPYPQNNVRLGSEWHRFDRNSADAVVLRLKLCSNIAKAVYALHAAGHYVIGDLKPSNIFVQPNGLVSIIDLDSCQITENGQVRFESSMNTPEFNPPEMVGEQKDASWDLFILGIIFYKVLCGIHPFFGTCKTPYQNCTLPELKIKEGLFPFGKKRIYFNVIPDQHNLFTHLPNIIQQLFLTCFEEGISNPAIRPTASDWIEGLTAKPVIKNFKADKEVVLDTQSFTLHWHTENGREAEIEGYGKVDLSGSIEVAPSGPNHFMLTVSNEFGVATQNLFITRFPTPLIESLLVPSPDFELGLNVSPIHIDSPSVNVSVNFQHMELAMVPEIKLSEKIIDTTHLFKSTSWWSISKAFEKVKDLMNKEIQ